jgi:APA family basic amino acid/polyamine antiporter
MGIGLNLLLTGVLVVFLIETDPLALALSIGWIVLGVVAYYGLNWFRSSRGIDEAAATDKNIPTGESDYP